MLKSGEAGVAGDSADPDPVMDCRPSFEGGRLGRGAVGVGVVAREENFDFLARTLGGGLEGDMPRLILPLLDSNPSANLAQWRRATGPGYTETHSWPF